ncbi:hypothetical protein PO909_029711 [Leuciscus waleckii]
MSSDAKKYVASCTVYQFTKPSQRKPAGFMVPIRPQRPWEYTGVDFVGPLPCTPCGNAYILVFVDYFSKWVEVSAVREATAQVAASKLLSEVFARHGVPNYLISDRGSPFVSELFRHVLTTLGSEHRLTTAYHPQTNATERVNRTLKTAIRAYVGNKHTAWDRYLPQICFALRTAPHESTGQSPSMLLYGRELNTPLDLITQPNSDGGDEPGIPYPESLESSIREAQDHARSVLDENHDKRKKYYDKRRRPVSYSVNGLVRIKTHPRSDALANFTAKLAPLYAGPYQIAQKLSEVNYRLIDASTGADAGVFHVVNLLPFHTWEPLESETEPTGVSVVETSADSSLLDEVPEETEDNAGATAVNLTDLGINIDYSLPVTSSAHDVSGNVDSVDELPDLQVDVGSRNDDLTVSDNVPDRHHCDLRPRRAPIITSDWLWDCGVTDEGCAALTSALRSNPSHLRKLSLSDNKVGDSGVKQLSDLLQDPHCKLEKLKLFNCGVTDEGCAALTSALRSNPSHLRKLDLSGNNLGYSDVKPLSDLKEDPHYKLETL